MASAMPVSTVSRNKANYLNKAANFAQKEIELMKALGYPNLNATQLYANDLIDGTSPVATNTYSCNNTDSAVGDKISSLLPNGTGTVLIEQVDIELVRLTVTLRWTEKGRSRSYTVASLVANI